MGEVHQLFSVNSLAPTSEDKAAFLELLAGRVRSGKLNIARAVLIFTDPEGDVGYEPFGEPTDMGKLVGMVEFAKFKMIAAD